MTREVPNEEGGFTQIEEESSHNKEARKKKVITIIAWYTPEIPVSSGPSGYNGLLGLILEANIW